MTYAIILSVPRVAAVRPAAAPAISKSILTANGVKSCVFDINVDYFTKFKKSVDPIYFNEIDEYLFIKNKSLSSDTKKILDQFIAKWVEQISNLAPEKLFISVFSWQAQQFTEQFLRQFRAVSSAKVIIGGQGLIREENGSYSERPEFAHYLKTQGLIDHWIRGEAETTIPEIVKGNYNVAGIDTDFLAERSNLFYWMPM